MAHSEDFLVKVISAVAIAHSCNDFSGSMLQSLYPMFKVQFELSYAQVGLISFVYQLTASLIQPWIGAYTDKHPIPYLLPTGMCISLVGVGLLSIASSFGGLLISSALIGIGSATFHPEASRVCRMASGGKFGTAQSSFQVGGYAGSSLAPLVAAALILPNGQKSIAWLILVVLLAVLILVGVSQWAVRHGQAIMMKPGTPNPVSLSPSGVIKALGLIGVLMLAKFTYMASISTYYTFYLVHRFGITLGQAQVYLFAFLAAVAVGTLVGGPVGDRVGRKTVIMISFVGTIPFSIAMPRASLSWTVSLTVCIGLILSSAFASMVVFAQEIVPRRTGMVAGVMFGTMFGVGGIAAASLGRFADVYGIDAVYTACGFLPLFGLATFLLPET